MAARLVLYAACACPDRDRAFNSVYELITLRSERVGAHVASVDPAKLEDQAYAHHFVKPRKMCEW